MILFHTLVSSPGWQVLAASELAAYRVVTRAVNVNLLLIFMFASSLLAEDTCLWSRQASVSIHCVLFVSLSYVSCPATSKARVEMKFFSPQDIQWGKNNELNKDETPLNRLFILRGKMTVASSTLPHIESQSSKA